MPTTSAEYQRRYRAANLDKLRANAARYYQENKEHIRKRSAKWQEENSARYKAYLREWSLQKHYKLTTEEYDNLLSSQAGVCAICKQADTKRLCVDHDHVTGRVRGLLCSRCNKILGNWNDDIEIFNAAIAYLKEQS